MGPVLHETHKIELTAPVMDDEIKKALWSIPGTKSPDPDGFTNQFYKEAWDIVGSDILLGYKRFFSYPGKCCDKSIPLL